ncbi:hypothetical protein TRICI_005290 [Trichomonascus ciferrii]|uniref:Uncharacterized protein n=1 Tax=Trichomonascus ciferrii TaxID=44093 RepID=A0A642UUD4_9ASCO|nr:hypothetical protein TRICI_005290 [Trichomonascus ciferrii]
MTFILFCISVRLHFSFSKQTSHSSHEITSALASLEVIGSVQLISFVHPSEIFNPGLYSEGIPGPWDSLARLWVMFNSFHSLKPRRATGWPPAIPNLDMVFSGGTPPDPQGSLRSRLWVMFSSFYSLKPRRATGVQGASPLQNPTHSCVFWRTLRSPKLASLDDLLFSFGSMKPRRDSGVTPALLSRDSSSEVSQFYSANGIA